MNVFADEKEKCVSGSRREDRRPPIGDAQAFRRNRKERYSQKRAGRQTDQRTKRLMLQAQRCADGSTREGENISRNDLPEWTDHLRACQRLVFFAAMLRLDGDVNEFVVFAEQLAIRIRALWLMRHDRDHRRKFSNAHLPNVQVGHE
jgi:hypothetical protein